MKRGELDVFTKQSVRGRGNKNMKLALAKIFQAQRITGWRRHMEIRKAECGMQKFKVKPDFVFPKLKLALFVDGCFWHGCPKHCSPMKWLKKSSTPTNHPPSQRSGRAFGQQKLAANKAHDKVVTRTLRRAGWHVLRIWEHTLERTAKDANHQARLLRRIQKALTTT